MSTINPSSSAMTIWHPDILNSVCDLLDTASIKALRLVNSSVNKTATPYLFRTLVLGLRKSRFARLKWVADRPKFAKGVREIIWETAHYHDDIGYDRPFLHDKRCGPQSLQWSEDPVVLARQEEHVLRRYRQMAADEEELLGSDLSGLLGQAFAKFSGLATLHVVAWHERPGPGGRLYRLADFEPPDYEPPPLRALEFPPEFLGDLDASGGLCTRQARDFVLVLESMAAAGRLLQHLHVRNHGIDAGKASSLVRKNHPFMFMAFGSISEAACTRITPSIRTLKTLRLQLSHRSRNIYRHASERGRLRRILADLPCLEELQILLRPTIVTRSSSEYVSWEFPIVPLRNIFGDSIWENLRRLSLESFWVESGDLCDFLLRHNQTLEDITLCQIRLGETKDAVHPVEGVGLSGYLPGKVYPTTMVVSERWDQIGKACQQLPKLTGLTILDAREGIHINELGAAGNFRVTDLGMNGRPNSHLKR